ncbi:hypothetical protein EJ110_NYTH45737, partial [Nymphaea thermarum]
VLTLVIVSAILSFDCNGDKSSCCASKFQVGFFFYFFFLYLVALGEGHTSHAFRHLVQTNLVKKKNLKSRSPKCLQLVALQDENSGLVLECGLLCISTAVAFVVFFVETFIYSLKIGEGETPFTRTAQKFRDQDGQQKNQTTPDSFFCLRLFPTSWFLLQHCRAKLASLMLFIPIYHQNLVPVAKCVSGIFSGITMLRGIGIEIFYGCSCPCGVERRLKLVKDAGLIDLSMETCLLFGLANGLQVGSPEFFYDEILNALRGMAMALYASILGLGASWAAFHFLTEILEQCKWKKLVLR